MANPQIVNGGAAVAVALASLTLTGSIVAPANNCWSIWEGNSQVVTDTLYTSLPITTSGITASAVVVGSTVTSITLQASASGSVPAYTGATVLANVGGRITGALVDTVGGTGVTSTTPTVIATSCQYRAINSGTSALATMPPVSSFILPAPLLYDTPVDDQSSGYNSRTPVATPAQIAYLLGLLTLPVQSVISGYHASAVVDVTANFVLYGSNDGSTWSQLDSTPTFPAGPTTQVMTLSASYQYFICSLAAGSNAGTNLKMTDFRLYDVNGTLIPVSATIPNNLTVSVIY